MLPVRTFLPQRAVFGHLCAQHWVGYVRWEHTVLAKVMLPAVVSVVPYIFLWEENCPPKRDARI